MTWEALLASLTNEGLLVSLTNGGAIAWLLWEVRQLRSELHSLRIELGSDLEDLRPRVRRIESRCLPARTCEEGTP